MPLERRSRSLSIPLGGYRNRVIWKNPDRDHVNLDQRGRHNDYEGSQVTGSENHHWPSSRGTSSDIGGEFFTVKQYLAPSQVPSAMKWEEGPPWALCTKYFDGTIYVTGPTQFTFPTTPVESIVTSQLFSGLDAWGTKAVALAKPTNSVANAATTLAELLREGIPRAAVETWQGRANRARDAGSDYLNYEFGWRPLVSEMLNFAKATMEAEKIMTQYIRDAGRSVRRRWNFPQEKTISTNFVSKTPFYAGDNGAYRGSSLVPCVDTTEVTVDRWFSGAFTYQLPPGFDYLDASSRSSLLAEEVFGAEFTPELIWNLAPWSWAVDWFTTVGDFVSNLSDWVSDGLVMRYGYIMQHTVAKRTISPLSNPFTVGGTINPLTFVVETKVRKKANPYGFGVSWEGLSPRQLAILAALGISKS